MPPDLNSLPTSSPAQGTTSGSPGGQRPRRISINTSNAPAPGPSSPRSPSMTSLQAAATINAGLQQSPGGHSPRLERRRSSLMNNLALNDPTIPAPGELQPSHSNNNSSGGFGESSPRRSRRSFAMASPLEMGGPHHHRQPSLGALHQELENEQEAQVNRLLHLIRIQQDQLAAVQRQLPSGSSPETSSVAALDPTSGLPTPPGSAAPPANATFPEQALSPSTVTSSPQMHSSLHGAFNNRPHSLSRQSPARLPSLSGVDTSSRGQSPTARRLSASLGPLSEDFLPGGTRDESAFYQAETQMLTRENQMLKLRIRELERQIADMAAASGAQPPTATSSHHSPLAAQPAIAATDPQAGAASTGEAAT